MKKRIKVIAGTLLIFALLLWAAGCGAAQNSEESAAGSDGSEVSTSSGQDAAPESSAEESIPEKPEPLMAPAPGSELLGAWYCLHDGVPVCLDLREDGAYGLTIGGTETEGTWEIADGCVVLDGDTEGAMPVIGNERIMWSGAGEGFQREEVKAWEPAPVLTEGVETADFDGYWVSWYVESGGLRLPADVAGDNTEFLIDGGRVAMGGSLFGEIVLDFTFADGRLSYENSKAAVVIEVQADYTLRCTVTGADSELILYLTSGDMESLPLFTAGEGED